MVELVQVIPVMFTTKGRQCTPKGGLTARKQLLSAPPHTPALGARSGFTQVELLTVLAILTVILGLLLPALAKVRQVQRTSACLNTLRNIGTAIHAYCSDNRGYFPDPSRANQSWEQMLLPFFRGPYACPSDEELLPVFGSSYDWRDTGIATTSLAGKSIAEIGRSQAVMVFESLPGWHAKGKINVVRVDHSVGTLEEQECFADLALPIDRPAALSGP